MNAIKNIFYLYFFSIYISLSFHERHKHKYSIYDLKYSLGLINTILEGGDNRKRNRFSKKSV